MHDEKKLSQLQQAFAKQGGKDVREWPHKFAPRDARSHIAAASTFFSLLYLDRAEAGPGGNTVALSFVAGSDKSPRKPREFELRPEPYMRNVACAQAAEAVKIIRCGALNAWLQRPVMLDRSVKWVAAAPGPDWRRAHPLCRPMDMALWAETVKAHVNCTNA